MTITTEPLPDVVDGPHMAQTAWVRARADLLAGSLKARIAQLEDARITNKVLAEHFACIGLLKSLRVFDRKMRSDH